MKQYQTISDDKGRNFAARSIATLESFAKKRNDISNYVISGSKFITEENLEKVERGIWRYRA